MNPAPASVPSGILGLDRILGGGLLRRGTMFVVGAPGTGKTICLQQLAFTAARAGRPAHYFTGLSEPHERLLEHIRPFSFFDDRLVGERVQLYSLASRLEDGADEAVSTIVQSARQARAELIVLDGFRGLRGMLGDDLAASRFIAMLGAQLGFLGSLLVVSLEGNARTEALYPELAIGDVVLSLSLDRLTAGHGRHLEVLKRRGAEPLPGLHAYAIGPEGVCCYPQFEVSVPPSDLPFDSTRRAAFGLPELDALLQGGLTEQTTTILAGSPGTGKTLLGLQFLAAGAARGEPGVALCFHESRAQLLDKAATHGIDLAGAIAREQLVLLLQTPTVYDPDVLAYRLQELIEQLGARRLVVDSLRDFEIAVSPERMNAYLAALVTMLRGHGVTSILTREVTRGFADEADFADLPVSVLAENVLLLRQVPQHGELQRVLTVLKMRFSDHDRSFRTFTIGRHGFSVLDRWQSAPEAPPSPG